MNVGRRSFKSGFVRGYNILSTIFIEYLVQKLFHFENGTVKGCSGTLYTCFEKPNSNFTTTFVESFKAAPKLKNIYYHAGEKLKGLFVYFCDILRATCRMSM